VTKVYAGGWGPDVPIAVPAEGRIQVIMQTLPGEERAAVVKEQDDWLARLVAKEPRVFSTPPRAYQPTRWMPPTVLDPAHPLVTLMEDCVGQVQGEKPTVVGAPYACDMFALHQLFDIPGVIFGPAGANAHAADEYIDLESLYTFWEIAYAFVLEWCGVD
jgi:acetylornithine deacetylase